MHYTRIVLLTPFFLVYHVNFIFCLTLKFYSGQGYAHFLQNFSVPESDEDKCFYMSSLLEVRSIKTDKCVILYEDWDCPQRSIDSFYSFRVDNDTDHFDNRTDLYKLNVLGIQQEDERIVRSFHVCSEERGGGPSLNLDMYEHTHYVGDILERWRGVCKCKNIRSTHYKIYSINNHGNGLYVFNKPDCRGNSTLIPAGDSEASRVVGVPEKDSIMSFRPAGVLPCPKLDASIYRFVLSNGSLSEKLFVEDVQMAPTATLVNIGSLPMSQVIEFSETVDNTVKYSVAHPFTQIHSTRVGHSFVTVSSAGSVLVGGEKFKLDLKENYQYPYNYQYTKANETVVVTESQVVKVRTTVQVAACERCHVTGYAKIVRDFPIGYIAEAVVKGRAGYEPLTASEIREDLPPGMKFVRDHFGYNVLVSVDGSMEAEFVWETFVNKFCVPTSYCGHLEVDPGKKTYVVDVDEEKNGSCEKYKFWLPTKTTCELGETSK